MQTPPVESTLTPYKRVCQLASGGMGSVDLALRHEGDFRRLYAIKRLHLHLREDADFRDMFMEEARIAGLIHHPNVVSVLDVGEDDDGPYLIMNFIDGLSLAELLQRVVARGEQIPMQVAVRIAVEIAKGLHAAHELRDHDGQQLHLVHRDLSPQNVMVSFQGAVMVTDFGIAKALGRGVHTTTGVIKGKIAYMAPEQLRYEDADRRSDLFPLGITLYEMLTGQRLYASRSGNDGVRRILSEAPPDLGDVLPGAPPALVSLLFDLLAKEPDQRPPTAAAVGEALDSILAELVAEEGRAFLEEFVAGVTEDLQREREQTLAAAITAAADGQVNAPGIVPVPPPARDGLTVRLRRRWPVLALAGAVLVAFGALAGFLGAQLGASSEDGDRGTAADGLEPVASGPPQAVAETVDVVAQGEQTNGGPGEVPPDASEGRGEEATAAPGISTTTGSPMRRRRPRNARSMRGAAAMMKGVTWYEW